jgi:hypothetical protein
MFKNQKIWQDQMLCKRHSYQQNRGIQRKMPRIAKIQNRGSSTLEITFGDLFWMCWLASHSYNPLAWLVSDIGNNFMKRTSIHQISSSLPRWFSTRHNSGPLLAISKIFCCKAASRIGLPFVWLNTVSKTFVNSLLSITIQHIGGSVNEG